MKKLFNLSDDSDNVAFPEVHLIKPIFQKNCSVLTNNER